MRNGWPQQYSAERKKKAGWAWRGQEQRGSGRARGFGRVRRRRDEERADDGPPRQTERARAADTGCFGGTFVGGVFKTNQGALRVLSSVVEESEGVMF